MVELTAMLEDTILGQLDVLTCGLILTHERGKVGLNCAERKARKLALESFEELAQTEGFFHIDASSCVQHAIC